jgi:signal transduction histidine kinase
VTVLAVRLSAATVPPQARRASFIPGRHIEEEADMSAITRTNVPAVPARATTIRRVIFRGERSSHLSRLEQLEALIEEVRSAGLETTLEVCGQAPEVPAGVQLTVYRLVQEALTNTLKHGGTGARATVRLRYLPGELRVDIDDDGAGATAPAPASVGGGLIGMQERVHAYGGDVQAGPRQPRGWQVSARLRLDGGDVA